ncbi:calcium-binding protein [Stagnihabitans tardus]|uniref:Uncharacterized protein n=1 Tax=Stagnihabitans tardus TaxID=2699202 RepID=A0AAE4Y7W5_9RHOB|nr:calcium-binding protein [Stagnihabitans tardus]NBZ87582.1 hypothetical protein [Stagnihabitans tardus]
MTSLTLAALSPAVTYSEGAVNAGAQLIDTEVTLSGPSDDYTDGNLTVSGLLAEDVVALRNQGNGTGEVGVSGTIVTFGGVAIGSLSGGAGSAFVVTFNADATTAAVQAVIENLTYATTSDAPTLHRTLTVNVTNAAGEDLGVGPDSEQGYTLLTGNADPFHGAATNLFSRPALVDFDTDGDLDVVVGEYFGPLHSFRNDGAAGFTELKGGDNPLASVTGGMFAPLAPPNFTDLDGDGDQDLVISNLGGSLSTYENDGAGAYTELTFSDNPFDGFNFGFFAGVTFTDLDGDTDLDMVAFADPTNVFVYLRDASGTFVYAPSGSNPLDSVLGLGLGMPAFFDMNGDGALDLIAGGNDGGLHVFMKQAAGGYLEATGAANPLAGLVVDKDASLSIGDVTSDGLADLVVNDASGQVRVIARYQTAGVGVEVTVTPENDGAPTGTLPASVQIVEDTATGLDLSGMTFADVDNDVLEVTLLAAQSSFLLLGAVPAGIAISGNGGGYLRLTGLAADLNAWLATPGVIGLRGATDASGVAADRVTVQVEDGTSPTVTLGPILVDIQNVNDAPGFVSPLGTVTVPENDANAGVFLFPTLVLSDPDGNMAGGGLTITGILAEETISLREGNISLSGADVVFGGRVVGHVSTGTGSFHVDFTADASLASVQAVLSAIVYHNSSDAPVRHDMTIEIIDGNGANLGGVAPWTYAQVPKSGQFNGILADDAGPLLMIDFDRDGDLDLAFVDGARNLNVYENVDGVMTRYGREPLDLTASNGAPLQNVTLVDLDGTGSLYALALDPLGQFHTFAPDPVDGTYAELTGLDDPFGGLTGVVGTPGFADLDGDGDLDMAMAGKDGALHGFERIGAGFVEMTGAADPFAGLGTPGLQGLALGDLDGDGDLDLVGLDGTLSLVSYMNNGDGTWAALTGAGYPFDNGAVFAFVSPTLADIDGDGDLDLLVPDAFDNIQTFLNTTQRGQVFTLDMTPQNDAPVITAAPTQMTLREDIAGRVDLRTLRLSDPDQNDPAIALTLSASQGRLSATADLGVQVLLSGQSLVLYGTASQIEAYLASPGRVQYLGAPNAFGLGAATLTLTVSDGHDQRDGGTIVLDITETVDVQIGSALVDVLWGDAGRDRIDGMGGDDLIHGGAGPDRLTGGTGFDTLDYSGSRFVWIDLNIGVSGNQRAAAGDASGDVISGFEAVIGSDFDDRLRGDAGANGLYGGAGDDLIRGGAGSDTMEGGAGRDTLDYSTSQTGVVVQLITRASGLQSARGGDAEGDVISGFEAIIGSGFDDILTGDTGNNSLSGKDGADRLAGGAGRDLLTGGEGADVFVFNTALGSGNLDRITDFTQGLDRVLLENMVFLGLSTGVLLDAAFRSNTTGLAEDASDRVIHDSATGALFFDADGLGGQAAVRFATVSAGLVLDHTSFFVH